MEVIESSSSRRKSEFSPIAPGVLRVLAHSFRKQYSDRVLGLVWRGYSIGRLLWPQTPADAVEISSWSAVELLAGARMPPVPRNERLSAVFKNNCAHNHTEQLHSKRLALLFNYLFFLYNLSRATADQSASLRVSTTSLTVKCQTLRCIDGLAYPSLLALL